jgi:hypothetical protein
VADGDASQTIPRIFWRRKKTRQFKMGDEVAVRGVVDGVEIARPGDTICAVRLRFRAAIPAEYMAWFHADALKSPKKAAK